MSFFNYTVLCKYSSLRFLIHYFIKRNFIQSLFECQSNFSCTACMLAQKIKVQNMSCNEFGWNIKHFISRLLFYILYTKMFKLKRDFYVLFYWFCNEKLWFNQSPEMQTWYLIKSVLRAKLFVVVCQSVNY